MIWYNAMSSAYITTLPFKTTQVTLLMQIKKSSGPGPRKQTPAIINSWKQTPGIIVDL